MTPLPDPNVLAQAVRTVAAENPNQVIVGCRYVQEEHDNLPCCIIGVALVTKLNYTTRWMEMYDGSAVNYTGITELYVARDEGTSDEELAALVWLALVQEFQDESDSWGVAVARADEKLDKDMS